MDEEAADELRGVERHGFESVFLLCSVVLPLKGNVVFIEGDETELAMATRWVYRERYSKTALGPANGGLAWTYHLR